MTAVVPNNRNATELPPGNTTSDDLMKEYVFLPVDLDVKIFLCTLRMVACVASFSGNLCVLRFLRGKVTPRRKSANLNVFIHSLAISDALLLGMAPVSWANLFYDSHDSVWFCKIKRFIEVSLPLITVYNLVVIGIERYILTCRPTSRPLSRTSIVRALKGAWVLGLSVAFALIITTYDEIRVEVNETHYTIACKYDNSNVVKVVVFQTFAIVAYLLPLISILFTCTSIIRLVLKRKRRLQVQEKDVEFALKELRLKQRKATITLMSVMVAFVAPYFLFIVYGSFNMIFKPTIDFSTDFIVRNTSGCLALMNGLVNFFIHIKQLNGFWLYLKRGAGCRNLNRIGIHNDIELQAHLPRRNVQRNKKKNKSDKACEKSASIADVHQIANLESIALKRHST